nr:hypothetical protein [Candidatus Gracilibacteria bacterium]
MFEVRDLPHSDRVESKKLVSITLFGYKLSVEVTSFVNYMSPKILGKLFKNEL